MNFKFFFKITLIFKQFHSSKFFRKLKISSAINSKRVRRNQFHLNWYWALQTRFQYSLSENISSSSTIKHNNQRPTTTKSTNPSTWSMPRLRLGCWLGTQSRTRRALAALCSERRGASLSSSLELAVWIWVGWGFSDEEEARTSQCGNRFVWVEVISVRNAN